MKGVLYSKFLDLVANAKYAYSTKHDPHAKPKTKITPIAWDSYVATAFVEVQDANGEISTERYDIVFKLESVAEEVRSRLHSMWAKKETAVSHDNSTSDQSDEAQPNYGATTASENNIAHSEGSVKKNVPEDGVDQNLDQNESSGTMLSPAEEEDGVDWVGSEEEDEGPPHPSASQTPSPQGEGSGAAETASQSGQAMLAPTGSEDADATTEATEDAVGLAREKTAS